MLIETKEHLYDNINNEESFYIYFSAQMCGVCKSLKPKVSELMQTKFPLLVAYSNDTALHPELAAQLGIYSNPSLIVYLKGKEVLRESRSFSILDIEKRIERIYNLIFD